MAAIPAFAPIEEAAVIRHGRPQLEARLSHPDAPEAIAARPDDRYLSLMTLRIFRAGLKHSLVDAKWPDFETVLDGFDIDRCAGLSDERLEELLSDRRLIRHAGKLRAIRANAIALRQLSQSHGGFGRWLADWPLDHIIDLWDALSRQFQQLGGNSAPAFLRMAGKDTFLLTDSVLAGLRHWQVIADDPAGRRARPAIQAAFNGWAGETARPRCALSQILAMSID
jgi:3-methyladenine DNA glycosylase Tag